MIKLKQITITEQEDKLLNDLLAVATAFLASVHAQIPFDKEDLKFVSRCRDSIAIEKLLRKINLEKFQEEHYNDLLLQETEQ